MRTPRYSMPAHARFGLAKSSVHIMKIVDFLRYVIQRDKLSIDEYLEEMGQEPFFLVAATGLGKTVAVPVHVFIRLMQKIGASPNPEPRVWVVEPRIPIAVDQMKFMNSLWTEYLQSKGEAVLPPLFGCISSASGNVNRDAPIKFVTTGIFELMAKNGELTPSRDRIIIDEAHVTVEQNPGVELGIALARKAGITIDYMSATIDTTTLLEDLGIPNIIRADKQRYDIWKHNLLKPMEKALPNLIQATLIRPDVTSGYFPRIDEYKHAEEVCKAVTEPGRSHGLLVVVNSFAGDQSDTNRLAGIIRERFPALPVLQLASEVVRDARREREFQQQLRQIEQEKQNYVILATSVVEMGITFPTLDFVATMDCGYDQETIGDVSFPVIAPLGINSLLQRLGRVGRRRPGIAYISYEVGADYSDLEDTELNGNKLRYEPIRFPMISAPLMPLAYYACTQEWSDLEAWVASLQLPSRLHELSDRMTYLKEQLELLEKLGLAEEGRLTPLGKRMEQWIGQADLAYTVWLQTRFEEWCSLPELMFGIVATALSNTPLVTLRAQNDFFVDFDGSHTAIAHEVDIWSGYIHEDVALFNVVVQVATMVSAQLFSKSMDDWSVTEIDRWCNMAGLDSRKLLKAGTAINNLWKLFCRINGKSEQFTRLFGHQQQPELAGLPWASFASSISSQKIHAELSELPGVSIVTLEANEIGGFNWHEPMLNCGGMVGQDDTPIELLDGNTYTAKLMPSRDAKGAEATWRLTHIGLYQTAEAEETTHDSGQPPSLLSRLWRGLAKWRG